MQYNIYDKNDFIQKNNIINKLNHQYQNINSLSNSNSSNGKEIDINHFSKEIKVFFFRKNIYIKS